MLLRHRAERPASNVPPAVQADLAARAVPEDRAVLVDPVVQAAPGGRVVRHLIPKVPVGPEVRVGLVGLVGHRPTSRGVDRVVPADRADRADRRPTSRGVDRVVPADRADRRPTSATAAPADQVVPAGRVGLVGRGGRRPTSTIAVVPTDTIGVRRGTRTTTTGADAFTERHGATDPRRGAGVRLRRRRTSGSCRRRGDHLRRPSTTGATRSSPSGIPVTTSGASGSSESGFLFRSEANP
jgi:hypothetical protein